MGDLGVFFSGGTPKTTNKSYYDGCISFIRSGEINSDMTELRISEEGLKNSSAKMVNKGEVLIALYGATSGEIAISKIYGAINQAILCFVTNENKQFFKNLWQKHNDNILKSYLQGGQGNLSAEIIKQLKFCFPTQNEQSKIASLFEQLEDRIEIQIKIIEELKSSKIALSRKMFSQELRFKNENGEDFTEWKEKKLGEISDVRDGTHDSPKYHETGYPFITSKNLLKNGSIDFENVTFINEMDYNKFNGRSKVEINDILFGMIGTIGNPVLVKSNGFAIKNVALIKQKDELLNVFLIHFLKGDSINQQFFEQNTGGTQKFLSLSIIRNLSVMVPSLPEQTKIANFLSGIDEKIDLETSMLQQLKLQKQYFLQQMFI